jgi:ferric-dicitrate binding protein FerR (iron transport regulator)
MNKKYLNNKLKYLNSFDDSNVKNNIDKLLNEIVEADGIDNLSDSDFEEFFNKEVHVDKNLPHILESLHKEIHKKIHKEKEIKTTPLAKRILRTYMRVASVLIIPILIVASYYYISNDVKYASNIEVKAPANSRVKCILPDSSVVWLNSGSSITYNQNFLRDREIELEGKAYFDVIHTVNNSPFSVLFKNGKVDVLGTKFSVTSKYNGNFYVVLEEGKVAATIIKKGKKNKMVVLKPGEMLVATKSVTSIKKVNAKNISAWIDGRLVFRNTPLKYVFSRISEMYNVEIIVKDKELYSLTYWGTFKEEKLEDILNLMSLNMPIKYEIQERKMKKDKSFTQKKVIIMKK